MKPIRHYYIEVSFTLNRGEIAVLAGPNGSGKSTLLKRFVESLPLSKGRIVSGAYTPGLCSPVILSICLLLNGWKTKFCFQKGAPNRY